MATSSKFPPIRPSPFLRLSAPEKGYTLERTFPKDMFSPFCSPALNLTEDGDPMEDEKLMYISEIISSEELRWEVYQVKNRDSDLQVGAESTPAIPLCKFCNNSGVLAVSLSMSSSELSSQPSGSIVDTPSSTLVPATISTLGHSPFPQALVSSGLSNPSGLAPFTTEASSGHPCNTELSCPIPPSSGFTAQSETITPSLPDIMNVTEPVSSMSEVFTRERPIPAHVDPFAASFDRVSLMCSGPNVASSPPVQYGISSLPISEKCSGVRTPSFLMPKLVFQRSVIRMQGRRHGNLKKDGPRVSFLEDNAKESKVPFVAQHSPRELLIHSGSISGVQKKTMISN